MKPRSSVICSQRSPSTSTYVGAPAGPSTSPAVSNLCRSSFSSSQSPVAGSPRALRSGSSVSSPLTMPVNARTPDLSTPLRCFESCCGLSVCRSMPVLCLQRAINSAYHLRMSLGLVLVPFFSAVTAAQRIISAGEIGFRCNAMLTARDTPNASCAFEITVTGAPMSGIPFSSRALTRSAAPFFGTSTPLTADTGTRITLSS
mmetsp:Transcript_74339/g.204847  ORF Transcript_74339/g.204847 Transcript_74339/m.204847 type:complete len:202 (+) Transcript_74339:497-1102(+)